VQYLCIRYADRLAENAIVASVGSKGDSYDNALAESFNGLYKWELIYRQGPWRGLDDVEFATVGPPVVRSTSCVSARVVVSAHGGG
jgi:putative transposase